MAQSRGFTVAFTNGPTGRTTYVRNGMTRRTPGGHRTKDPLRAGLRATPERARAYAMRWADYLDTDPRVVEVFDDGTTRNA